MTHCHSSGTKQNLQTKTKSWNHKKSAYILPANPRIDKPLEIVCVCVRRFISHYTRHTAINRKTDDESKHSYNSVTTI